MSPYTENISGDNIDPLYIAELIVAVPDCAIFVAAAVPAAPTDAPLRYGNLEAISGLLFIDGYPSLRDPAIDNCAGFFV